MSIYTTYTDCERTFYFSLSDTLSTITILDAQEGMSSVEYSYAYSIDNITWSDWTLSKQTLLTLISQIEYVDIAIYLKIRARISSDKTQSYAIYQLLEVRLNNIIVPMDYMEMGVMNNILVTTNNKNLFNPYRSFEKQIELHNKLSKSISDIFGIECIYFKTEPQQDSEDLTFKSFRLSDVTEYKQLKIVINNNELPDNRTRFTEFDIDFQDDLEIHIVIETFKEAFGEVVPNANDYLYLPLTNRMYQINTINDANTFMNHATYYQAMLVKYESRASVIEDSTTFDKIDELIDFDYEYAAEDVANEKADAVGAYSDAKSDSRQSAVSAQAVIIDNQKVFTYSYDFTNRSNSEVAHEYAIAVKSHEFALTFWTKLLDSCVDIFSLTNAYGQIVMSLQRIGSKIVLTNHVEQTTITVTTPTIALSSTRFYGISVNYAYEAHAHMLTLTIIDDTLTTVVEQVEQEIHLLSLPSKLSFRGAQTIAQIRMSKKFLTRAQVQSEFTTELPKQSNYYIIDNAVPSFTAALSKH